MTTATLDRPLQHAAPDRSLQQRRDALALANVIRTKRALLKRELAGDRVDPLELIVAPPEWLETMKIFDLLLAIPKFGRVKVNKLLVTCRISPSKTVGGLSRRQRGQIIQELGLIGERLR